MKTFVKLVSQAAGAIVLALALYGAIFGLSQTATPAPVAATCPWNFVCSVADVPTWAVCLIPLALLLLIIILIVALVRRRQDLYGQGKSQRRLKRISDRVDRDFIGR